MRSSSQNSYYWRCIDLIAKFYEKEPALLYADVFKVLRGEDGIQMVHALEKVLHNGGRTTQFKDDASATGKEKMSAYIDRMRQYYWGNYRLDIPPANEAPIEAYE